MRSVRSCLSRRPSPALVVSCLALFVAMGGTGYAALKLPKSSVGTRELRKGAVTSAKVKDGSLAAKDFKAGVLSGGGARGATGPQGIPGQNGLNGRDGRDGAAGAPGTDGAATVTVRTNDAGIPMTCQQSDPDPTYPQYSCTGDVTRKAACAPGERATGGGYDTAGTTISSRPDADAGATPTGWQVHARASGGGYYPSGPPATALVTPLTVYAICAAP
jgi:hypothetical protein